MNRCFPDPCPVLRKHGYPIPEAAFAISATIVISGTPHTGFCVRGFNPDSTAKDYYDCFWWDSLKGGPQRRGGRPSGGACDNWLDTGFTVLG